MKKIIVLMILSFLLLPQSFVKADGCFIPFEGEDLWEPSQTALILFNEGQEDIYLKVGFEGEVNQFAWIVPTPSLPEVSMAPESLFNELHELTKPLVKYQREGIFGKAMNDSISDMEGVTVHSQSKVGIYDVSVLSAGKAGSLYIWLDKNGYHVPEEARELFDWYIEKNWYFTAMKIDPQAKVDMLLDELREKLGDDVSWENATQKITDRMFKEQSDLKNNNRYPELFEWLREYDNNVYLNHLIFDFNEYKHYEMQSKYYNLESLFEYNLQKVCEIVNYDLVDNKNILKENCDNYYRYFEEYNVESRWAEEAEAVRKSDYYLEFKKRIEDLKQYYIEKFDLIEFRDRGLIGFNHDYNSRKGFKVDSLIEGFPAEELGIKEGDYIIEVDGKSLLGLDDRSERNRALDGKAGETNNLKVNRDGDILEFKITRQLDIRYFNIAERLVEKIKKDLENNLEPVNNGYDVKSDFYTDFLLSVFEFNEDNLKEMCVEDFKKRELEKSSGRSSYLEFGNISCQKKPGENIEELHVSYPDLLCSAKNEDSDNRWFDNCSYKYYYDLFNSKNETDLWFSINNKIEEYLNRFKQEYSSDREVDKYSDYLHPIKLSFLSNEIVYPLKISQFSTKVPESADESPKTNEVLLYVLAKQRVKAPEFRIEYANWLDASKVEGHFYDEGALKEILGDDEYFITKLRRSFARIEMDDDVYLKFEDNNDEYQMEISRSGDYKEDSQAINRLSESYENNNYAVIQGPFNYRFENKWFSYVVFLFWCLLLFVVIIAIIIIRRRSKRRIEEDQQQELEINERQEN